MTPVRFDPAASWSQAKHPICCSTNDVPYGNSMQFSDFVFYMNLSNQELKLTVIFTVETLSLLYLPFVS